MKKKPQPLKLGVLTNNFNKYAIIDSNNKIIKKFRVKASMTQSFSKIQRFYYEELKMAEINEKEEIVQIF